MIIINGIIYHINLIQNIDMILIIYVILID
jgi:hypothetical protein